MASIVTYGKHRQEVGNSQSRPYQAPASHQQFGLTNISQANTVELWVSWALSNSSPGNLLVGPRLKFIRQRGLGFPDETWVEFAPGEGIFKDKLKSDVGISAAVGPQSAVSIPPGQHTAEWLLFLPGPASSGVARNYWGQFDQAKFNFEVELFQVPFNGATRDDGKSIASHQYSNVFEIDIDAVPLVALGSASNGIQPRLEVRIG